MNKFRQWYYHLTGRDRFEFKDVGEAFTEWSRKTLDARIYLKEAQGKEELTTNCIAGIKREYEKVVNNMPPQDVRKLNRLIRNCGIDILIEEKPVRMTG